jgi:hypothetical protein
VLQYPGYHGLSADVTVLAGDVELANQNRAPDYCGSCYGASAPESGCCNSCEEVRQAYVRKGWSFNDPQGIEQCRDEGWLDKMKEQNTEGCRMAGRVKVNKVGLAPLSDEPWALADEIGDW